MKQFGTIMGFELRGYFRNKIFIGITLFLVVLMGVVMFFPQLRSAFGSDSADDTPAGELPLMLIKTSSSEYAQLVADTFAQAFGGYRIELTDATTQDIKEQIVSGEAECAFVMTSPTEYIYYVNNLSMHDSNRAVADSVLQQVYQMNAMIGSGMTQADAAAVMGIQINGTVENLGKNQMENFFYTYIMIFALYMVILLYGQMVATNVATEKSSRAMEVLITSARPPL